MSNSGQSHIPWSPLLKLASWLADRSLAQSITLNEANVFAVATVVVVFRVIVVMYSFVCFSLFCSLRFRFLSPFFFNLIWRLFNLLIVYIVMKQYKQIGSITTSTISSRFWTRHQMMFVFNLMWPVYNDITRICKECQKENIVLDF